MNRTLKASLLVSGIFACGVVVGAVGAKRLAPPPPPPVEVAPPRPAPEGFGPHTLRRLTAELELSDVQRSSIEPVIARTGEQLRVLRQESMRESGALLEAMNTAVAAELTPEQREKFEVLKEAQRARMRAALEERRRRAEGGERGERGEAGERGERRERGGDRPPPPP
jgi:Spy/CpxP family protein refolding chaperone